MSIVEKIKFQRYIEDLFYFNDEFKGEVISIHKNIDVKIITNPKLKTPLCYLIFKNEIKDKFIKSYEDMFNVDFEKEIGNYLPKLESYPYGGITFVEYYNDLVIGWDYGHYNDFTIAEYRFNKHDSQKLKELNYFTYIDLFKDAVLFLSDLNLELELNLDINIDFIYNYQQIRIINNEDLDEKFNYLILKTDYYEHIKLFKLDFGNTLISIFYVNAHLSNTEYNKLVLFMNSNLEQGKKIIHMKDDEFEKFIKIALRG